MKKLFLIIGLGFILVSCQNENEFVPESQECEISALTLSQEEATALVVEQKGTKIFKEEALQKAGDFFNKITTKSLDFDTKTYWIKINNYSSLTKSANDVVLDSVPLYLVNMTDGHSVLISGDRRIPEVLAFADGPLTLDRTNTGADVFANNLPIFVNKTINEFNEKYDSLLNNVKTKKNIENALLFTKSSPTHFTKSEVTKTPWSDVYLYAPLLNVKWGQGYPYNLETPLIGCGGGGENHPPLGCATIAVSQILSFHKYPTAFNGVYVNWIEMTRFPSINSLSSVYQTQMQKMLNTIAIGIDIEWGCNGSSSTTTKVKSYFDKIGYTSDAIASYNKSQVISSIGNSRPLYTRGTSSDAGHAWVIDGANKKEQTVTERIYQYKDPGVPPLVTNPSDWILIEERVMVLTEEYIHCNFGYEGLYNGYYVHGVFNLHDDDYGITGSSFNSDVKILTNIKRK